VIRTPEGVASGLGAKALVSFDAGYTALINNDAMTDLVKRSAEKLLGRHAVYINREPNMGVEDMAYFLEEIPGCFFFLGVTNEEKGITAHLHNGAFTIDEEALIIGTAIQCENIVSFLSGRAL
jgi:metal-dependent amidase/aminoacylase/carboxypeptidase family protein